MQRITQCRARAVIISIWIISVVVALPFAVFRKLFEIQVISIYNTQRFWLRLLISLATETAGFSNLINEDGTLPFALQYDI